MGNTGWRRSKNDVVTVTEVAAWRRVAAKPRKQRRDDDGAGEEEQTTLAWRRRRPGGGVLSRAGGGDGAAPPAPAGTVVTVKVVMRRKDAEALAARLGARGRKARMAELKGELRAGGDGCVGGDASAASCRDACWSPLLPPIKEN